VLENLSGKVLALSIIISKLFTSYNYVKFCIYSIFRVDLKIKIKINFCCDVKFSMTGPFD
jgi:hypothetical protein